MVLRPTTEFAKQVAKPLLVYNAQVLLVSKEHNPSLGNDDSQIADLILSIGRVQNIRHFYCWVLPSDNRSNLKVIKMIKKP
jgi:hypothetical protein